MLGLLCIGFLLSPFIIYFFGSRRDRVHEARDQRIQVKCQHLAALFEQVSGGGKKLARTYLQASNGDVYPYDLFMIEYYGGEHIVDTIWLPVREFFDASDDEIRQVLASELAQPGKYTIPDWIEALYQYVLHNQKEPQHKRSPFSFNRLLSGR